MRLSCQLLSKQTESSLSLETWHALFPGGCTSAASAIEFLVIGAELTARRSSQHAPGTLTQMVSVSWRIGGPAWSAQGLCDS